MSRHETRCQCGKLGARCISFMTAEDLLCDSCRQGCNAVWSAAIHPDDSTGFHFAVSNVEYGPMHWPDGGTQI